MYEGEPGCWVLIRSGSNSKRGNTPWFMGEIASLTATDQRCWTRSHSDCQCILTETKSECNFPHQICFGNFFLEHAFAVVDVENGRLEGSGNLQQTCVSCAYNEQIIAVAKKALEKHISTQWQAAQKQDENPQELRTVNRERSM